MLMLSILVNLLLTMLLGWICLRHQVAIRAAVLQQKEHAMKDKYAASPAICADAAKALDDMLKHAITEGTLDEDEFISLIMHSVEAEIGVGKWVENGETHSRVTEFVDAFVRASVYRALTAKRPYTGFEFIRQCDIYEVEMMARPDADDEFMRASSALRAYVQKLSCLTAGVPVFKSLSAKDSHNLMVQSVLLPAIARSAPNVRA